MESVFIRGPINLFRIRIGHVEQNVRLTDYINTDYIGFAERTNRLGCCGTHACQRGRYWIASAKCAVSMRSAPAKSAMVRASFRVRW